MHAMSKSRATTGQALRGRIPQEIFQVLLGFLQAYLLNLSRRVVVAVIQPGAKTSTQPTEKSEPMNVTISREEVSKSLADFGHSSRMAVLKLRRALRSAAKDIQQAADEHSHELGGAAKHSVARVGRYVRKKPLPALLISLGIGICLGAWARR